MRVPDGIAAIHCKAGKGRTGTMIICYLIFSGLFDNVEMACYHYAKKRTNDGKVNFYYYKIKYFSYCL